MIGLTMDAFTRLIFSNGAIMFVNLIILILVSMCLSKCSSKESFDPLAAGTSGADLRFIARSGMSNLGREGIERFLGRPEAPVYYPLGDTEMIRGDRVAAPVKEGLNTNDPLRWDRMGFTDKDLIGY